MKHILSVCPKCKKVIDSTLFEENGKIMLKKIAPEHGTFTDIYWSDNKLYNRFKRYSYVGNGVSMIRLFLPLAVSGTAKSTMLP